jgi:hypothetical protein
VEIEEAVEAAVEEVAEVAVEENPESAEGPPLKLNPTDMKVFSLQEVRKICWSLRILYQENPFMERKE